MLPVASEIVGELPVNVWRPGSAVVPRSAVTVL
jgi:hypothetical protein